MTVINKLTVVEHHVSEVVRIVVLGLAIAIVQIYVHMDALVVVKVILEVIK